MTNPTKYKPVLSQIQDLQTKISQAQPDAFRPCRSAGILAILNGKPEEAIQQFEKANKIRPYSRDLVGWYAESLSKDHPEQAEALVVTC